MLFESQSKADNFIRYNYVEITAHSDHTPSRSYYCTFCCGWHITSIQDEATGKLCDLKDEMLWEKIRIKCLLIDIENACLEIGELMEYADYTGAEQLIEQTRHSFHEAKKESESHNIVMKEIQLLEDRLDKLLHEIFFERYSTFYISSQNHYKR